MGLYLKDSDAALASGKLVKCLYEDLQSPPVHGEVYLCLTAPFNALLVVTDKHEVQRVTQRSDGWRPEAVYIAYIEDIKHWLPCDAKYITYGQ